MNRNIVLLSPHFPPHYRRFWSQIRQAGANALGIGDAPYESLSDELRAALTEYYRVPDMHDTDALIRACGYFTHRYGKIDRFESLNEYWLGTEARIRDDFNIPGVRQAGIDAIRRKSKMKEHFRRAGVRVARGRVAHTSADASALAAEAGYPLIAKPDIGVGALHTFRINSDRDLEAFFSAKPAVDYILEEFISGTIHSFDGLADAAGNPLFMTAHVFSQGIMETVNEARHIYYYSLREIPAELERIGRNCLAQFEVRERFFHMEFFRTADESYVALEVNMRPPGGYTTDMFNYTADIDIYRAWAELMVHGRTGLDYQRRYHCCYASRKQTARYAHSHEEILTRFEHLILQVESVPGVFRSALGDIGYIFRAPDLEQVLDVVRFIHAPGDTA
ncbi:MAG: ATP-grasp domain-containing protein [Desulfobacteraceae bacterium]|nr:MAG: ATP-grasp domain-containing protein [Desulfobacteraceae bacterium]